MSKSIDLRGTFLPVTTPFDPVTGDVDVVAFRTNLRSWFQHPLAGILIAGSTGESVLLDDDEVESLLSAARDTVPEDRILIVGTGNVEEHDRLAQVPSLAQLAVT